MLRLRTLYLATLLGAEVWLRISASPPMEILSLLGVVGRGGRTREHGPLHGQQLFDHGVLEELA